MTPDGHVVFADNFGRGFEWISLDSIFFKVEGRGLLGQVSLTDPLKYRCENEHRALATARVSSTTAKLHNAHVKVVQVEQKKAEGVATAGKTVVNKKRDSTAYDAKAVHRFLLQSVLSSGGSTVYRLADRGSGAVGRIESHTLNCFEASGETFPHPGMCCVMHLASILD